MMRKLEFAMRSVIVGAASNNLQVNEEMINLVREALVNSTLEAHLHELANCVILLLEKMRDHVCAPVGLDPNDQALQPMARVIRDAMFSTNAPGTSYEPQGDYLDMFGMSGGIPMHQARDKQGIPKKIPVPNNAPKKPVPTITTPHEHPIQKKIPTKPSAPRDPNKPRIKRVPGGKHGCNSCGRTFKGLSGLWYHHKKNPSHRPGGPQAVKIRRKMFKEMIDRCPFCPEGSEAAIKCPAKMYTHIQEAHPDVPGTFFRCSACKDFRSRSESNMRRHLKDTNCGGYLRFDYVPERPEPKLRPYKPRGPIVWRVSPPRPAPPPAPVLLDVSQCPYCDHVFPYGVVPTDVMHSHICESHPDVHSLISSVFD